MSDTNLISQASVVITNFVNMATSTATTTMPSGGGGGTNGLVWTALKFVGNNILLIFVISAIVFIWWKLRPRPRGEGGDRQKNKFQKFKEMLRDDILRTLIKKEALANGEVKADESLRAIADALVAGQPVRNMPSNILRIEYKVAKITSDNVQLSVVTLLKDGGNVIKRKTERDVEWIDVPNDMREKFIKQRVDSLCLSLFDCAEAKKERNQ